MLQRLGYRPDVAANGLEVLQALRRQSYDVIFMDIHMPEMDGMEATRHIHHNWPAEQCPRIIAMTANALQGDRERFLGVGMDDYISKPVRIEELIKALHQCYPTLSSRSIHIEHDTEYEEATMEPGAQKHNPAHHSPGAVAGEAITYSVLEHYLILMGEDGPEEIEALVDAFLSTTPCLLIDMHNGLDSGDTEKLYRAVHNLKPNSASVGAMVLSDLCQQFETLIRGGKLDDALVWIGVIETEYARVKTELDRGKWNMEYPL